MLSKLAVRRLTKLADYLDSLPRSQRKHFDMRKWFSHTGNHEHEIGEHVKPGALKHCGTTACALGWAATVPSFYKAGLRIPTGIAGGSWEPIGIASEFFEIEENDAAVLFFDCAVDIRSPKQWAKHCRKFLRDNA
jgi:hypothetical protein